MISNSTIEGTRLRSALEPLPPNTCQVRIRAEVPRRIPPGEKVRIPCEIENCGPAVLLSAGPYPVHLTYRWFQQVDGQVVSVLEGLRSGLDGGLSHQQSMECVLEVAAPEQEGRFILGITLVQEHVAWFDDLAPDNACCHPVCVSTANALDLLIAEIREMARCERRMHKDQRTAPPPVTSMTEAVGVRLPISGDHLATRRDTAAARVAAQLESMRTKEREYGQLIGQLHEIVQEVVPAGSTVMVVNRGDARLLSFEDREGWHFPQDAAGTYAGFYPADSEAAIAHLELLRARGGNFLVFPNTSSWWLEHYEGLKTYLDEQYRRVWCDRRCVIYDLGEAGGRVAASSITGGHANGRHEVQTRFQPTTPTLLSDWDQVRRSSHGSNDDPGYVRSA